MHSFRFTGARSRPADTGAEALDAECARAAGEYEQSIAALGQALADFERARGLFQEMEEAERTASVQEWREYLDSFLAFSKELVSSLDQSIENLS